MALYKELAEYTGLPIEIVVNCSRNAAWFLAKDWNPKDVIGYYRKSDLYIYDLTHYQNDILGDMFYKWFNSFDFKGLTGLDLGGGIGEYTIQAIKRGAKMTYLDIAKSKTLDYAKWRFDRNGVNPEIKDETYVIDRDFDFIIAMDVLEHLEEPDKRIKEIAEHTKFLFANPEQVQYNVLYPQHISKYDLTPYFKNINGYLWRRK